MTMNVTHRPGYKHFATLPDDAGNAVSIKPKGDKLVVESENGMLIYDMHGKLIMRGVNNASR